MHRSTLVLVIAAAFVFAASSEIVARDDRLEDNKRIVNGYLEVVENPESPDWSRSFADSMTFNGQRMPPQGLESILAFFRSAFPDLEFEVMGQIAEGDHVATWGFFQGTHRGEFQGVAATGKKVRWFGVAVDRIEDGKVVELWHEMDVWGLVRQLNAEETPGN